MSTEAGTQMVRSLHQRLEPTLARVAEALVDDPAAAVEESSRHLDEMIPGLAYLDDPGSPMAGALYFCAVNLSLYLAMRDRGVGVHDFGRTLLELLEDENTPMPIPDDPDEIAEGLAAAATRSQTDAKPGEFVFEVLPPGDDFDAGINILSCGICVQFSKYDAMDLVPYMCASDDVVSDRANQGLRRTGTIALGAHHCDFRYKAGGEPLRVAEQYPDRIEIRPRRSK